MTEHFPKSTETATGWCRQCNRNTEHRVDGGRGFAGHGQGWTATDVLRLEQIRNLVADGGSRRSQARSQVQMLRKQPNPKKRRKTRPRRS